ncbi:MAG: hypothetical protein V7709_03355 [Halioglobus sp.]
MSLSLNSPKLNVLIFAALFLLAVLPRLYSAQTVGWNWDYSGSFTLINFDEGGSCRAALNGFDYSTFVGRQTIAINEALGNTVSAGTRGNARAAKDYCHSAEHIQVARAYSAITGSLTVILIGIVGVLMYPAKPQIGWTAAAVLALSGFHVSESHSGTVDAPSVFFIYAFLALMVFAVSGKKPLALRFSPVLMVFAIWSKYWVFAGAAYLALVSERIWHRYMGSLSAGRITLLLLGTVILFALTSNAEFQSLNLYPVLALYYLLVPWRQVNRALALVFFLMPAIAYWLLQWDFIAAYTTGGMSGRFGAGYAAIGWQKWLRNPVNVITVLIVGLGLPACLFLPKGFWVIFGERRNVRAWLCFLPVLLFFLFMFFISPVTYYRHYLALIPAAALVVSIGLWSSIWSSRRWFLVLFFIWPAALMLDMEQDFHGDPRIELRQWYTQHEDDRVFASYYVSPPPGARSNTHFFKPEYAFGDAQDLRQAHYLILSENWYDTAFANELNGPYLGADNRLIKTTPEYARFYRQTLSGEYPYLELERAIDIENFMPELVLHKWLYGTFQLFVGDLKIYRVIRAEFD